MEMIDNGEEDYKIICVNKKDPRFEHIEHVDQLDPYEKKDIKTFFETYKIPQTGKDTVKVGNFLGPKEAYEHIKKAMLAYEVKFKK
jgi:inorganic pyrophosphatase